MGEPHVVSALREKRAEISGVIVELERRIALHRAGLVHLDATLRLFIPDLEPESIPPKKPPAARSHYFATGELARRCLDALRVAEGRVVAAEEIAVAALRDKGLDPEDRKTRSDFIQRVLNTLTTLKGKGTVEKVGHGLGARWRLPAEPADHAAWARCQ
ncbi:hypothetical protein HL658_36115 [Azospirillum sp. RWY-5-1]|uniref:HTH HARE-type domain-containing protein n=1 Tax=Azospirillum oleiclasticum TaxID=2735135 RepID=A0ABX2TN20_9PROT|nr:hypothetical protein [Azospirillum oleiclasticum]NYZ17995.1 hypothetical protein [Azospirillum oleiclasticum]NYZ25162.1 hypothetical protein [Azospirillum oleiclasticum]